VSHPARALPIPGWPVLLLFLGLPLLLTLLLTLLLNLGPSPARAQTSYGWPVAGTPEVGSRFQPPSTAWGAGHRGVDLLAPVGTLIRAAGPGRVTYAGLLAGKGVVTVTHADGLRTTHEPVAATVQVGDDVDTGDVLGTLEDGHGSCPLGRACLHWGLLRGATYLDPLLLVGPRPVRWLPTGLRDRQGLAPAAREPLRHTTPTASPQPAGTSRSGGARTLAIGAALTLGGIAAASRLRV
jgi:murein DD-endopeptidase MepM/ murein hydrolase activator NlpD